MEGHASARLENVASSHRCSVERQINPFKARKRFRLSKLTHTSSADRACLEQLKATHGASPIHATFASSLSSHQNCWNSCKRLPAWSCKQSLRSGVTAQVAAPERAEVGLPKNSRSLGLSRVHSPVPGMQSARLAAGCTYSKASY